ncbi:MAG TPA: tRNA (adenosine(37)-N6)-threonylcarbamoyltransferase complex dimerization subunit type 1 TsaB [Gemmatimonadota bacterium]|nr:tRNA (adenosine(37)-N6)-threonylcarbamoyltransferase complex dimerization subunit type 1 TsaB [Gemmatimonadota bacterium]
MSRGGSAGKVGAPRTVLAIDTATPAGAVALLVEERVLRRPIEWRSSFRQVAPALEALLDEAGLRLADLEAIAVPAGPGSFTGLRVGAAMALGLTRLTGRLYGVPTLAAVAEAYAPPRERRVCATLDARRGRRYAALYERAAPGRWELLRGPGDAAPEEVTEIAGGAPLVGPEGDLTRSSGAGALAEAVARLAAGDPRYALAAPGDLRLVYARPGVDPR